MKRTIRAKLLFGFLILMALLVVGYLVAEYRLDKVKRANAKIREEWTEMNLVNRTQLSLDKSIEILAEFIISADEERTFLLRQTFQASLRSIEQLERLQSAGEEKILEEELHKDEELRWISTIKRDFTEMELVLNDFLALSNPKSDARSAQLFSELTQLSHKVIDDLSQFRQVAQDELNHSIQVARQEENLSDRILFMSVLGMVLFGLVFSHFFSKSIATPIINLRNRSQQIGQGNFEYPLVASSNDEIADLDRALQRMAMNLKGVYENLEELVQERTEELNNTNEHLRQLFNGITDGISVIDREFRVINANSGLQRLTGLSEDLISATPCYLSFAGRRAVCDCCPALETFKTGQSASVDMIWEINGRKLHVEVCTFPFSQNGHSPQMVIEYVKDVSEKRRIEEQLFQSNKLAAVGTLSAGIAHEINNPLSNIACGAEAAASHLECGSHPQCETRPEITNYLKMIEKEVYHCQRITQSLLDFSRESDTERELLDLPQVIASTLELLNFRVRKKRALVCMETEQNETYLIGDRARLKQVFFNIISNALDAISDGGSIGITVRKQEDTLTVEIADNGAGISCQNLNKVFEPFFTTKPAGQGTGLGLAICYGIIRKHRGDITIASQGPDQGTSVTISLPVK